MRVAFVRPSPGGIARASARAVTALIFNSLATDDWVRFIGTNELFACADGAGRVRCHWISIAAAINSAKKIGSNTGGTSHSRTLNLLIFDILDRHFVAAGAQEAQIKAQIDETTSDYDREKLQEGLAKLAGGVAVIRAGGAAEVEVKERKYRVDDAMHATSAAVEEGILPGGGIALLRATEKLKSVRTQNDDQKTGVEIVRKALSAPARQIAINAGEDGSVILGKILEKDQHSYGFDSQTGEYGNLVSKGIIDPAKVVRVANQNAASVAALLVTTEAMVAEVPKKNAGAGLPAAGGGMGGMDF